MSELRKKQLVVIDGIIANADEIISQLSEDQEVLILSENNGLDEVKAYLASAGTPYETIHFITHGSDGAISINGETVTNENLKAEDWAVIGLHLTDDGDLLFYGCEIAKSDEGKQLIDAIVKAANADAAASIDLTGKDGDWELEYVSGDVANRTITVEGYDGNLVSSKTFDNETLPWESEFSQCTVINYDPDDHNYDAAYDHYTNVTFTDCTFQRNIQAICHYAYWNNPTLCINGSTALFEYNSTGDTLKGGGAIYTYGERGFDGGVFCRIDADYRGDMKIEAEKSTFRYNVAGTKYAIKSLDDWKTFYEKVKKDATSSDDKGLGGAICSRLYCYDFVEDEIKYNKDECLEVQTISNAGFYMNSAMIKGGAIYGHRIWFKLSNCSFTQNTAGLTSYLKLAQIGYGSSAAIDATDDKGRGGAIAAVDSSWFEFETDTTFNDNRADMDGGAIYCSTPAEEKGNRPHIIKLIVKGLVNVVKYAIPGPQGEKATTAARIARIAKKSAKKHVKKGAKNAIEDVIDNNGNAEQPILPEVYFGKNVVFLGNLALNGSGGAIALQDHGMALIEGKATFTGNTAGKNGGAVGMDGANTVFIAVDGADCCNNFASGDGGAFYIDEQSAVTLGEKSTFSGNLARGKNGGGAIYAKGETILSKDEEQTTLETGDITFKNNRATNDDGKGGACLLDVLQTHFCGYALFENNSASSSGGAIYLRTDYNSVENSDESITNCSETLFYDTVVFSGNSSGDKGGGLYVCVAYGVPDYESDAGKVVFYKDVSFSGNTADNGGNAMYLDDYSWVKFSGNMYLETNQTVYVSNGAVLEWDIVRDGDHTACISDYSLVSFAEKKIELTSVKEAGKRFILLNDRETAGKTSYVLAENAAGARGQTFSIRRKGEDPLSITVDSCSIQYMDYTYQLEVNLSNQLVLNVVGGVSKSSATDVKEKETFFTDGCFEDYTDGVFSIASGGMLDLYDATLKNNSGSSAAVSNSGTLYLDNVTFTGNTGGAIYNNAKATIELAGEVTLENNTIANYGNLEWAINRVKHGYLSDFGLIAAGTGSVCSVTLDPSECLIDYYRLASNAANADGQSFSIVVFDTDDDEVAVKDDTHTITVNGKEEQLDGRYILLYTDENDELWCAVKNQYIKFRTVVNSNFTLTEAQRFYGWTCQGNGSVFYVESTGSLNSEAAVSIKNCSATGNGGAIYNNGGIVTLTDAVFQNNHASGGGVIYNAGGTVTLTNAVFQNNYASSGGAIVNRGTLCLNNVTFRGNTVTEGTPAANGGAILNCNTLKLEGSVTLESDTDFITNNGNLEWVVKSSNHGCLSDFTKINNGTGCSCSVSFDASNCRNLYKLASNAAGAAGAAFTVSAIGSTESVTLTVNGETQILGDLSVTLCTDEKNDLYFIVRSSTIESRTVVSKETYLETDGVLTLIKEQQFDGWSCSGDGSVFCVESTGTLIGSAGTIFKNCDAVFDGGAICNNGGSVSLDNAFFTGNRASFDGGAIYNSSNGTVSLDNASFVNNQSSLTDGGAIYNQGTLTIGDVTFSGNTARFGGAIYNSGTITIEGSVTLAASSDTIYNNKGKMVWVVNSTKNGYISDYGKIINNSDCSCSITLDPSECIGNYQLASNASNADKATFTVNNAGSEESVTLTVNGEARMLDGRYVMLRTDENNDLWCTVKNNYIESRTVVSSEFTLTEEQHFNGWSYSENGSVFCVESTGTLTNSATVSFMNCYVQYGNGGTIYNNGGSVSLDNVSFSSNKASYGGAIYNQGTLTVSDGSFSGNTANDGSAIYNSGTLTVSDVLFSGNKASVNGVIYNSGTLTVGDVMFSGNTASTGGAIFNSGTMNVEGTVMLGTDSDTIYNGGKMVWVVNSTKNGYISDYGKIKTGSNCSQSVHLDPSECPGSYKLASNALTANRKSITANNAGTAESVKLTVNGDAKKLDGCYVYLYTDRNNELWCVVQNQLIKSQTTVSSNLTLTENHQFNGWTSNGSGSVFFITSTGTLNNASGTCVSFNDCYAASGGAIACLGKATLSNVVFNGNSATQGGAIYVGSKASVTLSNATFSGNCASEKGGAIYVENKGTLNIAGRITLATSSDTIYNYGTLNWNLTQADSQNNDFSVAQSRITGNGKRTITISKNGLAHDTNYILAEEPASPVLCMTAASPMLTAVDDEDVDDGEEICYYTIKDESGEIIGVITENNVLVRGNDIYRLDNVDGKVTFSVVESVRNLTGDAEGITWEGNAKEFTAQLSTDNFETSCAVITTGNGVNCYGLPEDDYQARVKNTFTKDWTDPVEITSDYELEQPVAWESKNNGRTDLFFANASGTWDSDYLAQHAGTKNGWEGTNETVALTGKNRLADTFAGSDDASILLLTDDDNGDALFVDDIYTAFPAEHQARIAQINQIRAGAGDDIVDLTSQRYEYVGDGIIVRGGLGDDIIWANNGENKLFGDAGNDRIVGASGNDVIAGGIGDDSMQGGGGDDIFTFCDDWGNDIVEQLPNGSVTLWFKSGSEDNWDQETMTYTDGSNTVKVTGVSEVTLKFGNDETKEYAVLAASGCFLAESSAKIFEDSAQGVLA